MITEQHNITELMQDRPYHQALGILLNTPEAVYMGPIHRLRSSWHRGLHRFADPDAHLGFSYAVNRMHSVGHQWSAGGGPAHRRAVRGSVKRRSIRATGR